MLKNKKCVPCEGGVPPLNEAKIKLFLQEIDNRWTVIDNLKLRREFHFVNFAHTMNFANMVGRIAEKENHHPDLYISYGKCTIELWTHAINGLSENDFILAAKIDEI